MYSQKQPRAFSYASKPQRHVWDFCISRSDLRELKQALIGRVGPATFKYGRAVEPESTKTSPQCRHTHSFQILSWNSASRPLFFFHHIVPYVFLRIWHIENSRASLWNPRYSVKGDLPEHFARTFSLIMQILHESEHVNFMTWLIINLRLEVFYLQPCSCEVTEVTSILCPP